MKRVAGMVVLQKLEKALVQRSEIMMNIGYVSLRWERGDCIQVMVFLGGHVAQAARRLATGSRAQVRSRESEGWRFSSLLHVQTASGIHSAYYKMSTRG